jgi:hypothetical protein
MAITMPGDEVKDIVYCKTNIGSFFFDAYLSMEHTSKLHITEFPVMTGASISDHSYLEARQLTIEVGMSDVAKDIVPGQFSGSWSRSVKANRIPIQVLTRLQLYKNMMIESLSVPDDNKTLYGLRASVSFKEILVATTQTVKISTRPQATEATNRGAVEPLPFNDGSILFQLLGKNTQNIRYIPLTSDPDQYFTCTLPVDHRNITLFFRIRYNDAAKYWVMTIADKNGFVMIDSIPLLPSKNLLEQYKYMQIGSAYIVKSGKLDTDRPDDTNLGTDYILVWGDTDG